MLTNIFIIWLSVAMVVAFSTSIFIGWSAMAGNRDEVSTKDFKNTFLLGAIWPLALFWMVGCVIGILAELLFEKIKRNK